MQKTKVFRSGNSQAIRLPKDLRIDQSGVWIERVGDPLLTDSVWELKPITVLHGSPASADRAERAHLRYPGQLSSLWVEPERDAAWHV